MFVLVNARASPTGAFGLVPRLDLQCVASLQSSQPTYALYQRMDVFLRKLSLQNLYQM